MKAAAAAWATAASTSAATASGWMDEHTNGQTETDGGKRPIFHSSHPTRSIFYENTTKVISPPLPPKIVGTYRFFSLLHNAFFAPSPSPIHQLVHHPLSVGGKSEQKKGVYVPELFSRKKSIYFKWEQFSFSADTEAATNWQPVGRMCCCLPLPLAAGRPSSIWRQNSRQL